MRSIQIATVLIVLAGVPSLALSADCRQQAENAAIAIEKKDNKKELFQAKNTSKVTDLSILKAYGVKNDEEIFSTEIYDSEGAFVPYDVVMKQKSCKIVSVKATAL